MMVSHQPELGHSLGRRDVAHPADEVRLAGSFGDTGYTAGVPREKSVKITVSIPVSLFDGADRLARRRGVPRSRLDAEALQHYVDEDSESEVTRQLDELAAEIDTSMDTVVKELQRRALARHGD